MLSDPLLRRHCLLPQRDSYREPSLSHDSWHTSRICSQRLTEGTVGQPLTLAAHDEDHQIKQLVTRLADRFPTIAGVVADVVYEIQQGFEGRPVRDFVPLLVERQAVRRLAVNMR
ncbi:three-helix bundle dimerization domain-containing protein [Nocardia sp. NPDC050793]|uniref:three-helix bundle dimerization domain-containing protein n=1 Tax=Nocardia sp. NPDC050793 TaxID=3155159 RepID=UPI0033D7B0B5